jgi:4-amino-4-deoxy-L-arabinose transferase-like glycosyltransferase
VAPPFRIVLLVLFLASLARGLAFAVAIPAWQGPDEPAHYAYVERLATGGFPPFQSRDLVFSTAVNVSVQRTITSFREHRADRPLTPQAERILLKREPGGLSTAGNGTLGAQDYPPLYYATLLPAYWLGGNTATNRLYAIRAVNALYGALFVLAIALLVLEVTRHYRLSIATGMLASLPPMVTQASATCTPDIALALFATASCWALVRLRRAASRSDLALAAAALLATALTKPVGAFLAFILLVTVGWPWLLQTVRRMRPALRIALGAAVAVTLAFAGTRAVNFAAAARHGALPTIRFGLSYLWQYYLPRLGFMKPAFDRSLPRTLIEPVPVWSTWVKTGAGYFGWLSAALPTWTYVVAVAGTVGTVLAGIAGILRKPTSEVSRTALRALCGIAAFIFVLHVTEIVSLVNGTGLVLQGRYVLPIIPLFALAFSAPLVHFSERARAATLVASLASWGIVSLVGFSTLLSFYST